jgi:cytidine deaminase
MQQINFEKLSEKEQSLLQEAKEAGVRYINKKGTRHIGAALLCDDGKIYHGVSIRRTNTSNSTCAERMALDSALFDQNYDYELLAIVGFFDNNSMDGSGKSDQLTPPCGTCRQILAEAEGYGSKTEAIPMLLANSDLSLVVKTDSRELLPLAYKADVYKKDRLASEK